MDVTLQWAKYGDASDQCSLSRIWGGIHPGADDLPGRQMGLIIGPEAFGQAEHYYNSSVVDDDDSDSDDDSSEDSDDDSDDSSSSDSSSDDSASDDSSSDDSSSGGTVAGSGGDPQASVLSIADDVASCQKDINRDGIVNVVDLGDLLLCFGRTPVPGCESEDVNTDGSVDLRDLIDVLLAFGTTCP